MNLGTDIYGNITRIDNVHIQGPVIYATVSSQSGISTWNFSIDFNDYGHITGIYWARSSNAQSSIPKNLADRISDRICERLDALEAPLDTKPLKVDTLPRSEAPTVEVTSPKKQRSQNKNPGCLLFILLLVFLGALYLISSREAGQSPPISISFSEISWDEFMTTVSNLTDKLLAAVSSLLDVLID